MSLVTKPIMPSKGISVGIFLNQNDVNFDRNKSHPLLLVSAIRHLGIWFGTSLPLCPFHRSHQHVQNWATLPSPVFIPYSWTTQELIHPQRKCQECDKATVESCMMALAFAPHRGWTFKLTWHRRLSPPTKRMISCNRKNSHFTIYLEFCAITL